jgi:hypothetical protein
MGPEFRLSLSGGSPTPGTRLHYLGRIGAPGGEPECHDMLSRAWTGPAEGSRDQVLPQCPTQPQLGGG